MGSPLQILSGLMWPDSGAQGAFYLVVNFNNLVVISGIALFQVTITWSDVCADIGRWLKAH